MKITVVMDNSVAMSTRKPFCGEPGLALLLETGEKKLLLDTGQTGAVVHNLGLVGVKPSELDAVIISHGHYDHTGGLQALLSQAGKRLPVYAGEQMFTKRFAVTEGKGRYCGVPQVKEVFESLGAEFVFVTGPVKIAENLWLSGPVPRLSGFEQVSASFIDEAGCHDPILDDMAIYYRTDKGIVAITGCAHSGIINIIRHGFRVTGLEKLYGIIGGTHLGPADERQQLLTLEELERLEPQIVAANHCTGFFMMARLQQIFGARFIPALTGMVIEFEF